MNYTGDVKTLAELEEMIDSLPDTISDINVQAELSYFNPKNVNVKPNAGNWKELVKEVVRNTLALEGGDEVDDFRLRCYYGGSKPDSSYYINLMSPASRDFSRRMSAGEFGSLD